MASYNSIYTGEEIDRRLTDVDNRIALPSPAYLGLFPRGNAQGQVDWVPHGQPTDAQTAAAVTAWLNAHPEATTTVQDGSLTRVKFAPGAVGAEGWTAAKTYAAGAYCEHNGYLWHNTSGAASTGVEPGTNYNVWNVTYSNKRLVDNSWFIVNQRGQSSYTGNRYTVDRWFADRGGTSVSASGLTLAPSVGVLYQYFEDDVWEWLGGRQVTLSIMAADGTVYSHTRSCPDYRVGVDTDQRVFANAWRYQLYSSSNRLQIRMLSGTSDVSIRAVKLEIGSVSTLANDTEPDYAEELAKCQRYFQRLQNARILFASERQVGRYFSQTLPLPTTMRAAPAVTYAADASGNVGIVQGYRTVADISEVALAVPTLPDGYVIEAKPDEDLAGKVLELFDIRLTADL